MAVNVSYGAGYRAISHNQPDVLARIAHAHSHGLDNGRSAPCQAFSEISAPLCTDQLLTDATPAVLPLRD